MPTTDIDSLISMYYSKGTDGIKEFMLRRAIDEIDDRLINDG